jgi:mannose-1-phosphate guanylyltransferase
MTEHAKNQNAHWCIVVADDHGPEYGPSVVRGEKPSPVQYCRLGEPATLLQKALNRARQIAPPAQILVTARDEYRNLWKSALWFVSPTHRFISDTRAASALATAAALLSIAADSPSNIVTILPVLRRP